MKWQIYNSSCVVNFLIFFSLLEFLPPISPIVNILHHYTGEMVLMFVLSYNE